MHNVAEIRQNLRSERLLIQRDYGNHAQPSRLLKSHTKLVDKHLCKAWELLAMPKNMTLVAVGGYGRSELYPRSDIDLLVLLPDETDTTSQNSLKEFVGFLWDIGLEVSHSIRTVTQCIEESADITVQTNLLEARRIIGAKKLFEKMVSALTTHLDYRNFYTAKKNEQDKRHARFIDADYNLEPNLKESPGGLRDLQTLLWISRACNLSSAWRDLAKKNMITPLEARAITRHERLLQDLRIRLHYLSGRREDRLLFDYQTELAQQLQITATSTYRPSEHMMQRYYRTKKAVLQLNAVLLKNFYTCLFPEDSETRPLNKRFMVRNNLLEIHDEGLFEREPSSIMESFLLLETHSYLNGFSATTLRALWRARRKIDAKFRQDTKNRALFMAILRQPHGLTHALRYMNQNDILGQYLPAFGRIVGQMQHDLFHVYTVDEHILMVIRNLRRLNLAEYAHENLLCTKLIKDFLRVEVLYIAGLFHDIAKGRGGDHSILGCTDAKRFCKQHELTREDTDLVIWLVKFHLKMSATAQKQDLSNQDVIANFAAHIKNDRYLVALYLFTVADIRGTSPKVWNTWKGKLLEDLFWATRRYMIDGEIADQVGEIRTRTLEALSLHAATPGGHEALWSQLDRDYFLHHEPNDIVWHTRLLETKVDAETTIVKTRLNHTGDGIQLMVYSPNQPYLFARICNFFERLNYSIMDAKIHTTHNHYTLGSFLVMDVGNGKPAYRDIMNYIEHELSREIAAIDKAIPHKPGRMSRQLKHFPIPSEVTITPYNKDSYLLSIISGDRPGLLARIAYVLARHNITIHSAKINTLGGRAEDVFQIANTPSIQSQEIIALREELLRDSY
ncbi:MAG: [protein-PII] uridylyltransferase [Candidatus Nitrotoga sp.]